MCWRACVCVCVHVCLHAVIARHVLCGCGDCVVHVCTVDWTIGIIVVDVHVAHVTNHIVVTHKHVAPPTYACQC